MTMTQTPIPMSERLRVDYHWTPRQRQVLDLIARGRSNTEIAEALGVSLAGAKWHVSEILSKLQADQREEAAEYWRRYNGLAPRFARVFRGAGGALTTKWVAGAAAAMIGATAAAIIIAIAITHEGNEAPASTTPTARPASEVDSPGQSAATQAPSAADTVAGLPVQKLSFGSPGRGDSVFPRDTAVFYSVSCYACDGAPGSLIRSYRDAAGTLHTDDLFANLRATAKGIIGTWESTPGLDFIATTVCDVGYCGGVAQASGDARQSLWTSSDGGVTWKKLRDVPADTFVSGVVDGDVWLSSFKADGDPQRWTWAASSGDTVASPVPGADFMGVFPGIGPLWAGGNGDFSDYHVRDGRRLFPNRPVSEPYAIHGRWSGRTYISWSAGRSPGTGVVPRHYLGVADDTGKLTAVFEWPNGPLRIVAELSGGAVLASGLLSGEAASVPDDRMFAYETIVVSLEGKVGGLPILELSQGLKGNANPFAAGLVVGPFARVNAGGDCLNVRQEPSATVTSLGCYADGVLLRDLGETQEAGGVTWLNVATPDGRQGWASTEFLER
jgi:DNA-binding CsgD family transcriptional regulator